MRWDFGRMKAGCWLGRAEEEDTSKGDAAAWWDSFSFSSRRRHPLVCSVQLIAYVLPSSLSCTCAWLRE